MRCRGEGREEGAILGSTSESLKKEMEVINQNYQNAPKYQPAVPPKLKSKIKIQYLRKTWRRPVLKTMGLYPRKIILVIFFQIACPSKFKRL